MQSLNILVAVYFSDRETATLPPTRCSVTHLRVTEPPNNKSGISVGQAKPSLPSSNGRETMGVEGGNSKATIEINDLRFTYPGIDGHPPPGSTPLIQDFSLTHHSGDRCLLVGSNGAGQFQLSSTLFLHSF